MSGSAIDHGELWNIDTLGLDTEVYAFHGTSAPFGSSAVAKAKKQFAQDYDVDFMDLVGKKVYRDNSVVMVAVVHHPPGAHHEVLP